MNKLKDINSKLQNFNQYKPKRKPKKHQVGPQAKKNQLLKKLTYDYIDEDQAQESKENDLIKEFRCQLDLNILPKNKKIEEKKPYKEDFFSNFETYHVANDYAEDIIAYLKERDVSFYYI